MAKVPTGTERSEVKNLLDENTTPTVATTNSPPELLATPLYRFIQYFPDRFM
jgi:hypothetical protein